MVNNQNIKIRDATLDDVIGIVYVQATTWIDTYPNQDNGVSEADIRSIDFHAKVLDWQHLIRSPNYKVWVAARDDEIVGLIAVRKAIDEGEIYEQCVLPQYQRQGLGSRLLQTANQWLGDTPISLRIISYNQKGVAFYKQHGFEISTLGEVDFIQLPTGKNIPTIEMRSGAITATPEIDREVVEAAETHPSSLETKGEGPRPSAPAKPPSRLVGRAELAKRSKLRASTIKFYTEIGLLPFKQVETRLARRYELDNALKRLQEIKQLRKQGLSIKNIAARLTGP